MDLKLSAWGSCRKLPPAAPSCGDGERKELARGGGGGGAAGAAGDGVTVAVEVGEGAMDP